jgi:hypothetical protein
MQCLIIVWGAFLCPSPCAPAGADTVSSAALCARGQSALSRGSYSEALACFTAASSAGLPKDSLCYFLSSIYTAKGAYDTALAFNFGMKPATTGLIVGQLLQRRAIYTALGWKKEAELISDSLMHYRQYRRVFFMPEIIANAGFDYQKQGKKEQETFPYQGPLDTIVSVGPGYGGGLSLHWAFPAGRKFSFNLDAAASAASMYYRPATSVDSMNISWGAGAGLLQKKTGLSLDLGMYRVVDYDRTYSTQNTIGISRTKRGRSWFTFFSGGYGIELLGGLAKKDQTCWLTGYFDQAAVTGKGLGLLVNASAYFAPPVVSDENFRVMYVEDISVKPVRHYYVDLQENVPSKTPIPIGSVPYFLPLTYLSNSLLEPAQNLSGIGPTSNYPRTYLSLSPRISFCQPLPLGLSLCLGAGITGDYYPEVYRWATFTIERSDVDTAYWNRSGPPYYLAYSNADGRYYWLLALDNIGTGEQYGGPVSVSRYEKRRIDAEGSLSVSLRRKAGNFGTFSIGANVSKNYSTLRMERFLWWQVSHVNAPFPMPSWSYGLTLNWNYVFQAN